MRRTFFILALLLALMPATDVMAKVSRASRPSADGISGLWYTEGHEGVVELYHCADKICGRFYWLEAADAENVSLDSRNPDPDKRERPLCRMQFMGGFTPDGNGHYTDGWIYSPRHGETFSGEITLVDRNTLRLHGYILLPVLGEDQIWTRATRQRSCASDS